jgi:hypothetical protein
VADPIAPGLVDPNTGLCLGCEAFSPDKHHLCDLECGCATVCECPNSVRFGVLRGEPLPAAPPIEEPLPEPVPEPPPPPEPPEEP